MSGYPSFGISTKWAEDTLTPAEIGKKVQSTLQQLEPIAPAMSNWVLRDGQVGVSLSEASKRMTSVIEHSLEWKYPDGPDDPVYGYKALVTGSPTPSELMTPDTVHLSLTAGGRFENEFRFAIGDMAQPKAYDLITYPIYRGAMNALTSIWPCPWAIARVFDPNLPAFKRLSVFGGAWVAYLSAPLAAGLKPPPELVPEPTPGGGLILSSTKERIDPANAEHMRRARLLEQIMLDRVGLEDPPRNRTPAWHNARSGPF